MENDGATGGKGRKRQILTLNRRQNEAPTDQTGKKPEDARGEPEQQERNREDMGVDENHRTEDMNRSKRGTFP
jgi:hypothetical protein